MSQTLYLLNFNNYYNRTIKYHETIHDYPVRSVIHYVNDINFNPNDYVETEVIVNYPDFGDSADPDYAILVDNDSNEIVSRWFIIEAIRIRLNQFKYSLKRDVVADYMNVILDAPCYVEKGYVGNGNVLAFNSEDVKFNQIKKGEYLLKNKLGTPWLVAYLSRYHTENEQTVYNQFQGQFIDEISTKEPDYTLESLSDYTYYKYNSASSSYRYTEDVKFCMYYNTQKDINNYGAASARDCVFGISKNGFYYDTHSSGAISQSLPIYTHDGLPSYSEDIRAEAYKEAYKHYNFYATTDTETNLDINYYTKIGTYENYLILKEEDGKIIKVGDKYYRIVANSNMHYSTDVRFIVPNQTASFGEKLFNYIASDIFNLPANCYKNPFIQIPYENPGIYFTFEEVNLNNQIQYNFTYTHNVTLQTPYEIIAAPLNDITFTRGNQTIQHNGNTALSWFLDMAQKGSELVYDVQIVPYCPIDTTDIANLEIVSCYYQAESPLAIAFKIGQASFSKSFEAPEDLPIDENDKVSINCDLYRLCSPNGIGDFDFSPAKNGGFFGYEVDVTLIPFNPYIKVNPVFNSWGLYGGDWNDYRGLICGGDFSLPITTDQWENYQLNNKNFQAVFDRETQTLEVQNFWTRAESWTSAVTGIVGGAAAGALMGGRVGGGYGAIGGAIVGGIASAGAGAADIVATYKLQEEQMRSREDLFNLNLRTIQARPNTLTRTTAYNINNKYFPYIEYYSCTGEEKQIFKNKLKYEGMTINAIGTIADYIGPEETFIKGKLIRIPDIQDDYHVAQMIVNELVEGVYLGGN